MVLCSKENHKPLDTIAVENARISFAENARSQSLIISKRYDALSIYH